MPLLLSLPLPRRAGRRHRCRAVATGQLLRVLPLWTLASHYQDMAYLLEILRPS